MCYRGCGGKLVGSKHRSDSGRRTKSYVINTRSYTPGALAVRTGLVLHIVGLYSYPSGGGARAVYRELRVRPAPQDMS
jgi:hypothetical protein